MSDNLEAKLQALRSCVGTVLRLADQHAYYMKDGMDRDLAIKKIGEFRAALAALDEKGMG